MMTGRGWGLQEALDPKEVKEAKEVEEAEENPIGGTLRA